MESQQVLWQFGIRTNGIAPGPIADTPGLAKLGTGAKGMAKTAMEVEMNLNESE
jgi:NAD(P)-dependent dehydrogenase (short-subunit alcohol dehydrogenase family)